MKHLSKSSFGTIKETNLNKVKSFLSEILLRRVFAFMHWKDVKVKTDIVDNPPVKFSSTDESALTKNLQDPKLIRSIARQVINNDIVVI